MQLSNMPDYRAHLSRHGHNLSHDFSFTSSTGHLLTVFAQHMNPKEHIKGHIDLFTRTQPLVGCPNADIEEYIDYFFVPYDLLWSGFGDSFFQTNEPFSSFISDIISGDGNLPVFDFSDPDQYATVTNNNQLLLYKDFYGLDLRFISIYRNLFHNFINPNCLFSSLANELADGETTLSHFAIPLDFYQPSVFPSVLLAYNAVYQHFYRLDDREEFDSETYNVDKEVQSYGFTISPSQKQVDIKYRSRDFDYFTAGAVAPLINPLNLQGGSANSSLLNINNYLATYLNDKLVTRDPVPTSLGHNLNRTVAGVGLSNGTEIPTTSNLRSMFAVEKLLSVTNRAKKTYDAQVMAHFGVSVPIDYLHQIQFIGQQKGMIRIGEVISTAGTDDNSLGDIAGKGYGNVNNKDIDFTAPCHGIVIGIFSCVPKVRYYSPLVKQFQLTNRLNFYMPEYEHLGMQPIYEWEAFAGPSSYGYKSGLNWSARTDVLGWQMRYEEFKSQISRVSPAFAKTQVDSHLNRSSGVFLSFNNWSSWVISTRPYELDFTSFNQSQPPLRSYLASPCMLNDIMAIQYPDVRLQYTEGGVNHGGYWDAYDSSFWQWQTVDTAEADKKCFVWNIASLFYRDPLLHFANCKFKLVSTMSDNTLPELGTV